MGRGCGGVWVWGGGGVGWMWGWGTLNPNMDVTTCPIKCGTKLIIHFPISTIAPLGMDK